MNEDPMPADSYLLEIAAFTLASAITAQAAGAHRIELCENPADGGTTPSYGTLVQIREQITIPVFPIIRPRGGDFLYEPYEFAAMQHDIKLCRQLGFEGVVLGLLLADGHIDIHRTKQLVELAYPMEVTFHRAFDRCANPLQSLEDVIACGCNHILSSGQRTAATNGQTLLKQLVKQANGRIAIMPGSGVRSNNIAGLAKFTGATMFHSSARIQIHSNMNFFVTDMQEELVHEGTDAKEVKAMRAALADLQ